MARVPEPMRNLLGRIGGQRRSSGPKWVEPSSTITRAVLEDAEAYAANPRADLEPVTGDVPGKDVAPGTASEPRIHDDHHGAA